MQADDALKPAQIAGVTLCGACATHTAIRRLWQTSRRGGVRRGVCISQCLRISAHTQGIAACMCCFVRALKITCINDLELFEKSSARWSGAGAWPCTAISYVMCNAEVCKPTIHSMHMRGDRSTAPIVQGVSDRPADGASQASGRVWAQRQHPHSHSLYQTCARS